MIRVSFLVLSLAATTVACAEPAMTGKAVFDRYCIHCHAAGHEHPGTRQLALTRGEDKALLEERDDLEAEYVRHVVRHGLKAMPAFVPSELTDTRLKALVDYLTQ